MKESERPQPTMKLRGRLFLLGILGALCYFTAPALSAVFNPWLVMLSWIGVALLVLFGRFPDRPESTETTSRTLPELSRKRGRMTTRVVCWNIAGRKKPWEQLVEMDADVALLQEALTPHLRRRSEIPEAHWNSHCWNSDWYKAYWPRLTDRWPAVVRLSNKVEVDHFAQVAPISETRCDQFAVSGIGTVTAARVRPKDGTEPFIVVSMYARWMGPHPIAETNFAVGYADGSAHRIISDLSAFIGKVDPSSHRIIAAGDLNTIYGAEDGSGFRTRDDSIWSRMDALGLEFLGPQAPNGRQAEPQPDFMPCDTKNVVTYYTSAQKEPAKADRQLDYVFASRGFDENIRTCALNSAEEEKWGASDHCRLLIEVDG